LKPTKAPKLKVKDLKAKKGSVTGGATKKTAVRTS
jgi:hypothetical protein